jgi:hypothetical protein
MNFTAAIINLIDHLPWLQGAPADGVGDQPREDHLLKQTFDAFYLAINFSSFLSTIRDMIQ